MKALVLGALASLAFAATAQAEVINCGYLIRPDGTPHPHIGRPYVEVDDDHVDVLLQIRVVGERGGYSRTAYKLYSAGAGVYSDGRGHATFKVRRSGAAVLNVNGMIARCQM